MMRFNADDERFHLRTQPVKLNSVTFTEKCQAVGLGEWEIVPVISYVKDLEEYKRPDAYALAFTQFGIISPRPKTVTEVIAVLEKAYGGF